MALRRQQPRLARPQLERALVALERGLVVPEVVLAEALVERRAATRVQLERERLLAQRDGALRVAGRARRLRRARQQVDAVHGLVPELERALEVHARLRVGEDARGLAPGRHRGLQRLGAQAGAVAVVRALRGFLQFGGERAVQRRPLSGEQALVEHLPDQAVPEGQPVVRRDQHARVQARPQRVARDADALEQVVRTLPAGRGEHGQHVVVQPFDAREHRLGDRPRARREQLLDEERVAARARVQLLRERRRNALAREPFELARDLLGRQRSELDALHEVTPRQLAGEPPQLGRERVVDAVAGQHHEPLRAQIAREEGEQRERRAIGPVDVLEHEQNRPALLREPAEQLEQRARRAGRGRRGRASRAAAPPRACRAPRS